MNLTYGAELEFADVLYGQPLPEGNAWNKQDYSIVNSNGIANCPIGKFYEYGGEINTPPTDNVEDQVANFIGVLAVLKPAAVVNYRTNLHIHVGLKGLSENLNALKALIFYIDEWQENIFELIEPIPEPTRQEYPVDVEYKGAMKRFRRRQQSHQARLSKGQVKKMLEAKTTEEFYLAHFRLSHAGVPQKHLAQRTGINLRSLWENNETIEFRHFPGTTNPEQFRNCVTWCSQFMEAALITHEAPVTLLSRMPSKMGFPKFKPYVHWMEERWNQTSHSVKPDEVRMANIRRILIQDESIPTNA